MGIITLEKKKKKIKGSIAYYKILAYLEWSIGIALGLAVWLRSKVFVGSLLAISLIYFGLGIIFKMKRKETEKLMTIGFFLGSCGLLSYSLYWAGVPFVAGYNIGIIFSYVSVIIIALIFMKKKKLTKKNLEAKNFLRK